MRLGVWVFVCILQGSMGTMWNAFDIRYWRCVLKRTTVCPDPDIKIFLFTSDGWYGKQIDIRNPNSLRYGGWDPGKKNVIIIHGFNGTSTKTPMTILRAAYTARKDYNVFMVDWEPLTKYPCYLSSISNTRLVAQCSAQFYSHLTHNGALAKDIHCVGHSLGAHICGMMSNHLTDKQHKIVGLDPARPLIDRFGNSAFRLTRDDAQVVQVIHTNAGGLGEEAQVGHVDFCINGGRFQPGCKGHRLRRARCSHFQSACYFAATVSLHKKLIGRPCSSTCPKSSRSYGIRSGAVVPMGEDTPDSASGTYCVTIRSDKDCPFD